MFLSFYVSSKLSTAYQVILLIVWLTPVEVSSHHWVLLDLYHRILESGLDIVV